MTTEPDTAIALARRESIADALRRSARRDPERVALRFAERSWTYAALDAGANRVARRFAQAGLEPGQRVAAYGRNSDAYLLTWLACLRAGLVHVPVNYALTAGELGYIVRQSGASALVCDAALAPNVAASEDCARVALHARFAGAGAGAGAGVGSGGAAAGASENGASANGASASGANANGTNADAAFDVLATALDESADASALDARYAHPVAQILYTSGTTAEPKGAVMTHGALLAHYASCIASAELAAADRSLDALPLYHSAQMHVILMPHLLLGATSVLIEAPEPATVLRLIEEHRITSFFAPPTVWISLLRHPDFDRRDLSSLRKVYYGASIMPVPVLEELRSRLPAAGAWNLYGQSEIGPLATVLRPEEHDERPALGRAPDPQRRDARGRRGHARRAARRERRDRAPLAAAADRVLEQARGDGGGVRGRLVPQRRRGLPRRGRLSLRGGPAQGRHQHRRDRGVEPRDRGDALHPPGGVRGVRRARH